MTRTVFLKMHAMQGRQVLSCCDSDLLGKQFTEGKCCLRVTESFYKGTELTIDDAKEFIKDHLNSCDSVQIIGDDIINALDGCGLISKTHCRTVSNVPHLIFVRM